MKVLVHVYARENWPIQHCRCGHDASVIFTTLEEEMYFSCGDEDCKPDKEMLSRVAMITFATEELRKDYERKLAVSGHGRPQSSLN